MMAMPSGELGDLLVAEGTEALLPFPKGDQSFLPCEALLHRHVETFLEVEFPVRVKGIGSAFDLAMPFDRHTCCSEEADGECRPIRLIEGARKDPVPSPLFQEVFVLDPAGWFVLVSVSCPLPQQREERIVYISEDLLARCVSVIQRPAPEHGVELLDQGPGTGALVGLHDVSHSVQQSRNGLL